MSHKCTYGIFKCLNVEEKQLAADLFLIFCKKRLKKVKIYDVSKIVQNPIWKLKKKISLRLPTKKSTYEGTIFNESVPKKVLLNFYGFFVFFH